MYAYFTDPARKVIQLASEEARRLNHEYVGTEHILLALVKEGSGAAATMLKNLNVGLQEIRLEVEKFVAPRPDMLGMTGIRRMLRAKKVMECAIAESAKRNHDHIGTEHILLGLLLVPEGVAFDVLTTLSLTLDRVREAVLRLHEKAS